MGGSLSRIRYPSRAISHLQRFRGCLSSGAPAPADYLQKRGRDKGPIRARTGLLPDRFKVFTRLFGARAGGTVKEASFGQAAGHSTGGAPMTRPIRASRPFVVALALALLAVPLVAAVQLVSDIGIAFAKGPGGGGSGGSRGGGGGGCGGARGGGGGGGGGGRRGA